MRDSCVHYHVTPGCICSKTAFSPRGRVPLMRLWEQAPAAKCVMILWGAACLAGWPSDLLHLLTIPRRPRRDRNTSQLSSLQATADSGNTASTTPVCHAGGINLCQLNTEARHWKQMTAPGKKASLTHLWVPLTGLLPASPEISTGRLAVP